MEIEIKVNITPQQYIRLDNMARRMRRPMDKALGWMVTHHMDSILETRTCICFGFVLGTVFTTVCLLADKKKAPARSGTSDKRNPKG